MLLMDMDRRATWLPWGLWTECAWILSPATSAPTVPFFYIAMNRLRMHPS